MCKPVQYKVHAHTEYESHFCNSYILIIIFYSQIYSRPFLQYELLVLINACGIYTPERCTLQTIALSVKQTCNWWQVAQCKHGECNCYYKILNLYCRDHEELAICYDVCMHPKQVARKGIEVEVINHIPTSS